MEYKDFVTRQVGVFTLEELEKIHNTTVAVVGLGGTGSTSAVLAAKAGLGRIIAVDKDSYELCNVVEQILATTDTLGVPKAKVAERVLATHGPLAEVKGVVLEVRSVEDAKRVLQGADYLISAVDDALARVVLDRAARELGISSIVTANIGWKVLVSVHPHDGTSYEEFTRQFSFKKEITPQVEEGLHLQQKVYIACAGDFEPDYAEQYLRGEKTYISYMAPPALLGASVAVSELLKLVSGKGQVATPPNTFGYDTLENKVWDSAAIGETIGRVIATIMTQGLEAGIAEWKRRMNYS